jgi:hypothetical protein
MKFPSRSITALVMTVIYLLITLSPLAHLATLSRGVAHAVTGQCSGNCDIDGCSPERRASRTCCCWRNKQKKDHYPQVNNKNTSSCCKTKPVGKVAELRCSTCPCGSNKLLSLWGAEKLQHLPYRFISQNPPQDKQLHTHPSPRRLISRHGEPPDPPPIISIRS